MTHKTLLDLVICQMCHEMTRLDSPLEIFISDKTTFAQCPACNVTGQASSVRSEVFNAQQQPQRVIAISGVASAVKAAASSEE
jgi:hypothetical protein